MMRNWFQHLQKAIFKSPNNSQSSDRKEKEYSCSLPKKNIRCFYRHRSLPSQKNTVSNQYYNNSTMSRLETRSTNCWLMHVRQKSKAKKYKTHCSNTSKLVWNSTKNSVYGLKVPLWNNVGRGRIWIRWNVIVRVSLCFWIERNQKSSSCSQCQCCTQVFRIVIRQGSESRPFTSYKLPSEPYVIVSHHTALQQNLSTLRWHMNCPSLVFGPNFNNPFGKAPFLFW